MKKGKTTKKDRKKERQFSFFICSVNSKEGRKTEEKNRCLSEFRKEGGKEENRKRQKKKKNVLAN